MKARTIGIVAALGLAGLVSGCKDKNEHHFYNSTIIVDKQTGATLEMDISRLLVTKGNMSFYTEGNDLAEVDYKNSNGEEVELHVYFIFGEVRPSSVEINGDYRMIGGEESALYQNALRHYEDVCRQLQCNSAMNQWNDYRELKIEQYRRDNEKNVPPQRLD